MRVSCCCQICRHASSHVHWILLCPLGPELSARRAPTELDVPAMGEAANAGMAFAKPVGRKGWAETPACQLGPLPPPGSEGTCIDTGKGAAGQAAQPRNGRGKPEHRRVGVLQQDGHVMPYTRGNNARRRSHGFVACLALLRVTVGEPVDAKDARRRPHRTTRHSRSSNTAAGPCRAWSAHADAADDARRYPTTDELEHRFVSQVCLPGAREVDGERCLALLPPGAANVASACKEVQEDDAAPSPVELFLKSSLQRGGLARPGGQGAATRRSMMFSSCASTCLLYS